MNTESLKRDAPKVYPLINSCQIGHQWIRFEGDDCPLCAMRRELKAAHEILSNEQRNPRPTTKAVEQALERLDNAIYAFAKK